jgi:hypothetical protein
MMTRVTAIALLASVATTATIVRANPPEVVRFHGVIAELQGQPPTSGNFVFLAEVFDQAVGGAPLYSQSVTASVASGDYTLVLSPEQPGALNAAFADGPRFLEITVLTGPTGQINQQLLPRQEIASVPYALLAGRVPETAPAAPRGYIDGFITSRASATTIDVGPGIAASDDGTHAIESADTQTLSIAATGAGGLEEPVVPAQWYHIWKIVDPVSGAVNVFGSIGLSPTLPSPYSGKRRIGSFRTNAASQVIEYVQHGDAFLWKTPPALDVDEVIDDVARELKEVSVPNGIVVEAILNVMAVGAPGAESYALVTSPDQSDVGSSRSVSPLAVQVP